MTHLNIQQGLNIEVVSTNLIKKLYEAALSVPEPLEGELDAAYMSGNLLVDKSYRTYVSYLTGRFPDLHINVTDSYYIPFEDSAVLNVLLANNIGSDSIGITEAEAANATLTAAMFLNNTDITSFDAFKYFTKANTNPPSNLFKGCINLASINLLNASTISENEFSESGITSVNAPSLTFIGYGAFQNCVALTGSINYQNLTSIGESAFAGCSGLNGTINLPNLTSLGGIAFANTNITSIVDLGNLTSLEPRTFQNCTSLVSADLSNITSFGWSSFIGCSNLVLDVATLSTNTTFIGELAFNGCTKVTGVLNLPNLTRMDNNAFRATGITSITSLGNLTSTPTWGFQNCRSLTTVTLPSGLTTIGRNCFDGDTSLTSINLSNVTSIEMSAFVGCTSLGGTINLPNLTSLGAYAFCNTGISVLDLGPNLSSIGNQAFWGSTSSTFIFRGTTVPSFSTTNSDKFLSDMSNVTIYVPESAINDYKTAWPAMASNIVKIEGSVYDTQS